MTVLCHSDGPCYRCLHPNPPPAGLVPNCEESGVLGVLPGVIGVLQANEVLKLLLKIGRPLIGHMTLLNALDSDWKNLTLLKNEDCHLCGKSPTINTLVDYEDLCGTAPHISATELKTLKNSCSPFFLLDVRRADEAAVVSMGADQQFQLNPSQADCQKSKQPPTSVSSYIAKQVFGPDVLYRYFTTPGILAQ